MGEPRSQIERLLAWGGCGCVGSAALFLLLLYLQGWETWLSGVLLACIGAAIAPPMQLPRWSQLMLLIAAALIFEAQYRALSL